MSQDVVCIHGMWSKPNVWDEFKARMESQGYRVHTPALLHHESLEAQQDVDLGKVSINDYVRAMTEFVSQFDKPIIVGHSMGGLIAQAVAARTHVQQLILLSPAAPAGVMGLRPSVVRIFFWHMMKWKFWAKPMRLSFSEAHWGIYNGLSEAEAREHYDDQVNESGRAAAEIAYWMIDPNHATRVAFENITCPVLMVGAENDRIVPSSVCRAVAKRYINSQFHEIKNSGHYVLGGKPLDEVLELTTQAIAANAA